VCAPSCVEFAKSCLNKMTLSSCSVLEVGSCDVNGSLRRRVEPYSASYIGVDIQPGPGVDRLCDAADLEATFGRECFDLILCTEVLEHVAEWRTAVQNIKAVLRPGGTLLLTTRSRGFGYHGYPYDFWRYEPEDIRRIFSDFDVQSVVPDPGQPGIFMHAVKPLTGRSPADMGEICLYSVLHHKRMKAMPADWERTLSFRVKKWVLQNRRILKKLTPAGIKNRLYDKIFR